MSKINFSDFVVRRAGQVDVEASSAHLLRSFLPYLSKLQTSEDTGSESVAGHVSAIFDSMKPEERITSELLVMAVLGRVATPDPKVALETKKTLLEYLKRNTGDKENGATFGSKQGRNGGMWRWVRENPAIEAEETEAAISEAAE